MSVNCSIISIIITVKDRRIASPFERFVILSLSFFLLVLIKLIERIFIYNNFRLFWNQTSFADNSLYLSDR